MDKTELVINLEFIFGPLVKDCFDKDGKEFTGIKVVDEDEISQALDKQINEMYSDLWIPDNTKSSGFRFDELKEIELAPKFLKLLNKLIERLNLINDGSFIIIDKETKHFKELCLKQEKQITDINKLNVKYNALGDIKLYENIDEVKSCLKRNRINFKYEFWPNKKCTPEVPWEIIKVGDSVSMFFAKAKLFKIYLEKGFKGSLENGIKIGMKWEDALKIDKTLTYDDDAEAYHSIKGYWIEDSLDKVKKVLSIEISIKEAKNDEEFYKYEW